MESFGQSLLNCLHTREEENPSCLVLSGVAVGGVLIFLSPPVFFFYCANTFLLHRQAGMLTHKPCKELKLARADGKKRKSSIKKFLQNKKSNSLKKKKKKAKLNE